MIRFIKKTIKTILFPPKRELEIRWVQKNEASWLTSQLKGRVIKPSINPFSHQIEQIAKETNDSGPQPLWEGYQSGDPGNKRGNTRKSNEVRTDSVMGDFYAELVRNRKPTIVVEFGTAFGVSGMYFLSGLEVNANGRLLTYEPNDVWAGFAKNNLSKISNRFQLTVGTFEENIDKHLGDNQKIDIAFIDAIHTSAFVFPQLDIVVNRSKPGTIILLDDINFSPDMEDCWDKVSKDPRFSASAFIGNRVGVVEVK